jgi:hypothetical protein
MSTPVIVPVATGVPGRRLPAVLRRCASATSASATFMFAAAGGILLAAVVAGLLSGAQRRLD